MQPPIKAERADVRQLDPFKNSRSLGGGSGKQQSPTPVHPTTQDDLARVRRFLELKARNEFHSNLMNAARRDFDLARLIDVRALKAEVDQLRSEIERLKRGRP
jgi:hypothetical protein